MDQSTQNILWAQLRIHYAVQQLVGADVLGSQSETEIWEHGLGEPSLTVVPVQTLSFSSRLDSLPILKMSLVSTMAVTMLAMHVYGPGTGPLPAQSLDTVAFHSFHAAPGFSTSSSSSSSSVPGFVERVPNAPPDEHAAATDASSSSMSSLSSENASSSSSSVAAASESSATLPAKQSVVNNQVGVYLSASSIKRADFLLKTLDSLQAAGGTALVFDVKGGAVLFHSAAPMANEINLVVPFYELPALLKQLHDRNIYAIGRFVAIKDGGLAMKLPDTRVKNPKTGVAMGDEWVDPANETAIKYNMEVICELSAAGIDEINLDYIRFSTANFGALRVFSGQQKADHVEAFIKAARETIDRCGPHTKLGLSTFAILGWDYKVNVETLGQDVIRFAPLVDVISPMAYPATFKSAGYYVPGRNPGPRMYWLVYRTLKGYADMLGPDQAPKIRPWIQGYYVGQKDVADQIRAVYDAGACGWQVWNANNNYGPAYAAIKADTLRPARCRND